MHTRPDTRVVCAESGLKEEARTWLLGKLHAIIAAPGDSSLWTISNPDLKYSQPGVLALLKCAGFKNELEDRFKLEVPPTHDESEAKIMGVVVRAWNHS